MNTSWICPRCWRPHRQITKPGRHEWMPEAQFVLSTDHDVKSRFCQFLSALPLRVVVAVLIQAELCTCILEIKTKPIKPGKTSSVWALQSKPVVVCGPNVWVWIRNQKVNVHIPPHILYKDMEIHKLIHCPMGFSSDLAALVCLGPSDFTDTVL